MIKEINDMKTHGMFGGKTGLMKITDFLMLIHDAVTLVLSIFYAIFVEIYKFFIRDSPKDIKGDVVLVTGAAHGIGRELALQYTALGCTVVCVDINEEGNKETVRTANDQNCGTAYGYKCDITNRSEVQELSEKVRDNVGTVTVIVNNAGIMITRQFNDYSENEIRKIIDVNVLSQFWIIQAFLPYMCRKYRGHIIAISSVAGKTGLEHLVPYCASKFAVHGLMESLTEEIRRGSYRDMINTTIVSPYMVDTGLCKVPRMRFPNVLGFITPQSAASAIISAHRLNRIDVTIPVGLKYLDSFTRIFPTNVRYEIKDFIDSGVEPEP